MVRTVLLKIPEPSQIPPTSHSSTFSKLLLVACWTGGLLDHLIVSTVPKLSLLLETAFVLVDITCVVGQGGVLGVITSQSPRRPENNKKTFNIYDIHGYPISMDYPQDPPDSNGLFMSTPGTFMYSA